MSLEQIESLAKQLPPLDKLRLIESLVPGLETQLRLQPTTRRRSLRGILKGNPVGDNDISELRREFEQNFPREGNR